MNFIPLDLFNHDMEGATLIEASAGTGKTYTITGLYLRLLLERDIPPQGILVVTYTEAATKELRGRIRAVISKCLGFLNGEKIPADDFALEQYMRSYLGKPYARRILTGALQSFDEASIHTIHAFCRRILSENPFESGSLPDTEFVTDDTHLSLETVYDFYRRNIIQLPARDLAHVIPLMKKKGMLAPDKLASLLSDELALDPGIPVLPDEVFNMAELDSGWSRVRDLYDKLKSMWQDQDEHTAILADLLTLGGKSYNSGVRGRMESALSDFFKDGDPLAIPGNFSRWTPSIIKEKMPDVPVPAHPFFVCCGKFQSSIDELENLFMLFNRSLLREFIRSSPAVIAGKKSMYNLRSFNDLLLDLHNALAGQGGAVLRTSVARKYRAALIDEFQDTDPLQYGIFTTLFGDDRILYLIGDPKQAIYAFRGADIFSYMRASSSIDHRFTLSENHRSTPDMINAVNTIFSRSDNPFVFDSIRFLTATAAGGGPSENFHCSDIPPEPLQLLLLPPGPLEGGRMTKGEAEKIASSSCAVEIAALITLGRNGKALIGERPIQAGDIAVLVRTRTHGQMVQRELGDMGVRSVMAGAGSVFESPMARDLYVILHALASPSSDPLLCAALSTIVMGRSAADIAGLRSDDAAMEEVVSSFYDYSRILREKGFMTMALLMMENENVRERLLGLEYGERYMTDFLHLCEIIHNGAEENHLCAEGLLSWFSERLTGINAPDENQIRLESDESAVRIITVHKSKGLQFPVVFCPMLWGRSASGRGNSAVYYRKYHDSHNGDIRVLNLDVSDETAMYSSERENLAEELRLLYVAMTRSRYRLYLTWGCLNEFMILKSGSALAYLLHGQRSSGDENTLDEVLPSMKYDDILADCEECGIASGGTIGVSSVSAGPAGRISMTEDRSLTAGPGKFSRVFIRNRLVTSYSALAETVHSAEKPDYDMVKSVAEVTDDPGKTVFSFPAGTDAGTCLHSVFERIDYSHPESDRIGPVVKKTLGENGLDLQWADVITAMIQRVLTTPLPGMPDGFSLSALTGKDRICEMEFYISMQGSGTIGGLTGILGEYGMGSGAVSGDELSSFLRGFIDLVFRCRDRYYIVDWKSNLLGKTEDYYSENNIRQEMSRHNYYLQYHLYTLALHRYLGTRLQNYSYEKNFGGVYYLFIRGMNGTAGSRGIYHDRPPEELVAAIDRYLEEKNDR